MPASAIVAGSATSDKDAANAMDRMRRYMTDSSRGPVSSASPRAQISVNLRSHEVRLAPCVERVVDEGALLEQRLIVRLREHPTGADRLEPRSERVGVAVLGDVRRVHDLGGADGAEDPDSGVGRAHARTPVPGQSPM